jgi:hypothetical protein
LHHHVGLGAQFEEVRASLIILDSVAWTTFKADKGFCVAINPALTTKQLGRCAARLSNYDWQGSCLLVHKWQSFPSPFPCVSSELFGS